MTVRVTHGISKEIAHFTGQFVHETQIDKEWSPEGVATAVLHKHHSIIRVGAGLIQFVYRSHLRSATEATRNRNAFSPFFARVFLRQ